LSVHYSLGAAGLWWCHGIECWWLLK
jgi:hypothetical protein